LNNNRPAGAGGWLREVIAVGIVCLLVDACARTPTRPGDTGLPTGRWTGEGVWVFVTSDGCDLVVGCGHGQFPPPVVHADGTFKVNGTYRIEAGPVSINPAPPATFSGVLTGQTLMLSVTPTEPSLQPASYVLQPATASAKCTVPCV
jgi:hypothetical protein